MAVRKRKRAEEVPLRPAMQFSNGRTVRTLKDAIFLLREHEMRPGVDDRDEVLHLLERARSEEERAAAIARFRQWAQSGGLLPVTTKPGTAESP